MPSTMKEAVPASSSAAGSPSSPAARPQPVCLEVPVTLNGVRGIPGTDKREPFSESTRTVIVFSNGAVLRLSAALAPGQLVFLVNERTRKEIVCQVVKSKNYRNVTGYVEVEFTETAVGFWGMRFPGDKLSNNTEENPPAAEAPAAPGVAAPVAPPSAAPSRVEAPSFPAPVADGAASAAELPRAADIRPRPVLVPKPPAAVPAPPAAKTATPAAASLPVPKSKPAQETEELPAWLTSAAYSGLATPVRPSTESTMSKSIAELQASIDAHTPKKRVETAVQEEAAEASGSSPAAPEAAEALPDPADWEQTEEKTAAPQKSGRARVFGAIAAILVLGLGAGGWWYYRNVLSPASPAAAATPQRPAPNASRPNDTTTRSADAGTSSANVAQPIATQPPAPVTPAKAQPPAPTTASFQPPVEEKKDRPAAGGKKDAVKESPKEPAVANAAAPAPEQPKKPALTKMQLASPIVLRNAPSTGAASPDLNLNGVPGAAIPADGSNLISSESQPVAPAVPVGGQVNPAVLLAKVAPQYPALAQRQHLGGAVTLNAEVREDGRIGAVKVVSGPMLLRQAAIDAVKQWKYQPAQLDGKAVASQVLVNIQFRAE